MDADVAEFEKELRGILDSKPPVTSSKIQSLTKLAMAKPQLHFQLTRQIEQFAKTCPSPYKLAGLYVIDGIAREAFSKRRRRERDNVPLRPGKFTGEEFLDSFEAVLVAGPMMQDILSGPEKDKEKISKTIEFWLKGAIFGKDVVEKLKAYVSGELVPPSQVAGLTIPAVAPAQSSSLSAEYTATLIATLSTLSQKIPLGGLNLSALTGSTGGNAVPQPAQKIIPAALKRFTYGDEDDEDDGLIEQPTSTQAEHTISLSQPTRPAISHPSHLQDPRLPPQDPRTQQAPLQQTPTTPAYPTPPNSNSPYAPATQQPSRPPFYQSFAPPPLSHGPGYGQQGHMPARSPVFPTQPPLNDTWQYDETPQDPSSDWPPEDHGWPPRQDSKEYENELEPVLLEAGEDVPDGYIKVLSRTLFVGGVTDYITKDQIGEVFGNYGRIVSIMLTSVTPQKQNAFVKFQDRASAAKAFHATSNEGAIIQDIQVKVGWAYGFGPKECFDYQRGESIIPLADLSDTELQFMVTSRVGGFMGLSIRDRVIIEEPQLPSNAGGFKKHSGRESARPNFQDGGGNRGNWGPDQDKMKWEDGEGGYDDAPRPRSQYGGPPPRPSSSMGFGPGQRPKRPSHHDEYPQEQFSPGRPFPLSPMSGGRPHAGGSFHGGPPRPMGGPGFRPQFRQPYGPGFGNGADLGMETGVGGDEWWTPQEDEFAVSRSEFEVTRKRQEFEGRNAVGIEEKRRKSESEDRDKSNGVVATPTTPGKKSRWG